MNLASWIVLIIIVVIVVLDIRYLLNHGLEECGGNCSSCGTQCKWQGDIEKARKRLAFKRKLKKLFRIN